MMKRNRTAAAIAAISLAAFSFSACGNVVSSEETSRMIENAVSAAVSEALAGVTSSAET